MKILYTLLISIAFSGSFSEPDFIQKKNKNISIIFTDDPPIIDGILDKTIWSKIKPVSDFLQEYPISMSEPSQLTEVRILYDEENIYVFAQMYVNNPENIIARLVNRDNWEEGFDGVSDYFSIDIDSRHDHQTGFIFSVNAAGVQADAVVFDDAGYDAEWNAVWESKVSILDDSWVVEMKIPFTCLRFTNSDKMTWGLNLYRYIHYNNEYIAWVAYPRGIPGISSKYGHLVGFKNILSNRRIEIMPHLITGRSIFYDVNLKYPDFDPLQHDEVLNFHNETNYGVDLKFGLGTNSTLDLTFNPDFGQIEADPSEINLTYYQTRFSEKRAFFMENNTIFDSPIEIFYSRRIGEDDAVIKNAEKITGKTSSGFTYGFIHAATENNYNISSIQIDSLSNELDTLITNQKDDINYLVTRFTKDVLVGNSYFGIMSSHYYKNNQRNNNISLDGVFSLLDNRINTDGQFVFSQNDSILGIGFFGEFKYTIPQKFNVWIETDYYDKNFNVNNVGYLRRNNFINNSGGIDFLVDHPQENIKLFKIETAYKYNGTIDGLVLDNKIETNFSVFFTNYYELGFGISRNFIRYDDWATYDVEEMQVGPILKLPQADGFNFYFLSDDTKPFIFNLFYGNGNNTIGDKGYNYSISGDYRFTNNFNVSMNRYFGESSETYHWIEIVLEENSPHPDENHYIFANSKNQIYTTTYRLNGNITKNLGFQLYSEFFTNRNNFVHYSELLYDNSFPTDTTEYIKTIPYVDINPSQESGELLDPNLYVGLYSKFSELNTNFVLKWQFSPGSNIYIVYSLNKFVNGKIFKNYFEFLQYNEPKEWEEIFFDQSIYIKLDYWFNI